MVEDRRGPRAGGGSAEPPNSNTRRGWLSDIYFPTLLDPSAGSLESLVARLGGRSTVDDPMVGRATGLPDVEKAVGEIAKWLRKHSAAYAKSTFTMGLDRDATEGALTLQIDSKKVELPVAVISERRKSREVELRVYYATAPLTQRNVTQNPAQAQSVRAPVSPSTEDLPLPLGVAEHIDALKRGELAAVLQTFETTGALRDSHGKSYAGDDLRDYYTRLIGTARDGGLELQRVGIADDGRICALEYNLVAVRGKPVPPQAGLAVFERGDSGLLKSVRMYENSGLA